MKPSPAMLPGRTKHNYPGDGEGRHNNHAERREFHYDYRDRIYRRSGYVFANLTIQGSGSLTVNVPKGKVVLWTAVGATPPARLTIKDGAKITTNGGLYGLSAKPS